jgi:hypothetical protein
MQQEQTPHINEETLQRDEIERTMDSIFCFMIEERQYQERERELATHINEETLLRDEMDRVFYEFATHCGITPALHSQLNELLKKIGNLQQEIFTEQTENRKLDYEQIKKKKDNILRRLEAIIELI